MYPAPFRYHRPGTIQEVINLLVKFGDDAKVLAGGQTLLPMLKMRIGDMAELIDLGHVPNMSYIEQRGDSIHIGAMTTYATIASSDLVEKIPLLKDCAGGIADKQVRNVGTIGGSLSVADSSGDLPSGLRVLDVDVICVGPSGSRSIHINDFITDSYTTVLKSDELLTEIKVKLPPENSSGAYIAFKRSAPSYPTASAGVQLAMNGDVCEDIRLVLGAAGSTAITSPEAEALLRGKTLSDEAIKQAADVIVGASNPPSDARGSEQFKRAMLHSILVEAVHRALARQQGDDIKGGHRYA